MGWEPLPHTCALKFENTFELSTWELQLLIGLIMLLDDGALNVSDVEHQSPNHVLHAHEEKILRYSWSLLWNIERLSYCHVGPKPHFGFQSCFGLSWFPFCLELSHLERVHYTLPKTKSIENLKIDEVVNTLRCGWKLVNFNYRSHDKSLTWSLVCWGSNCTPPPFQETLTHKLWNFFYLANTCCLWVHETLH